MCWVMARKSRRTLSFAHTAFLGLLSVASVAVPSAALAAGAHQACGNPLDIQVRLDRLGFSPGVIDGHLGRTSERAVQDFQTANSLPASGTVDCATWKALAAES